MDREEYFKKLEKEREETLRVEAENIKKRVRPKERMKAEGSVTGKISPASKPSPFSTKQTPSITNVLNRLPMSTPREEPANAVKAILQPLKEAADRNNKVPISTRYGGIGWIPSEEERKRALKTAAYTGESMLRGIDRGLHGVVNTGLSSISALLNQLTKETEGVRLNGRGEIIPGSTEKVGYALPERARNLISKDVENLRALRNVEGQIEEERRFQEKYQGLSPEERVLGDVTGTIGQMLPSVLANTVLPGSGLPTIALSAAGNGIKQALSEGATEEEALLYGSLSGALEAGVEKLSGGIGGLGKGYLDDIVKNIVKLPAVRNALGEGAEEMVTEFLDPYVRRMTYDENAEGPTFQDMLKAFGMGSAIGGIMSGGQSLVRNLRGTESGQTALPNAPMRERGITAGGGFGPVQLDNDGNSILKRETLQSTETPLQRSRPGVTVSDGVTRTTGAYLNPTIPQQNDTDNTQYRPRETLVPYTSQEARNFLTGTRNKVVGFGADIVDFVKNALGNKKNTDKLYLGKLPENTAFRIEQETGMNVRNFNVILPSERVRHIIRQHGNQEREILRGQKGVTAEDFSLLEKVIADPDRIIFDQTTDSYQRPVVRLEKDLGNIVVTAQAITEGNKTLNTDTFYIRQKSPLTGVNAKSEDYLHRNVRNAPQQDFLASTIPQRSDMVNTQYATTEKNDTLFGKNTVGAAERMPRLSNEELIERYGALKQGGEPRARDILLPRETPSGKTSRFVQTASESAAVDETLVGEVSEAVRDEMASYIPVSNQKSLNKAEEILRDHGYDDSLKSIRDVLNGDKRLKAEHAALAERLILEAQNRGDYATARDLIMDLALAGTEGGQFIQALGMIKRLSPEGQLLYLEKTVNRLNKGIKDKNIGSKTIKIPEEVKENILSQTTREGLDAAVDHAIHEVAQQMPATLWDKIDAWRYLSMLGNPRTHIRNIVGNAVFVPAMELKNAIGIPIERLAGAEVKSKAFLSKKDRELLEFAKSNWEENKDVLQSGGKYDTRTQLEQRKRIFKSNALESVRKKASELLEMEDLFFLKRSYVKNFARFLKANHITESQITDGSKEMNEMLQQAENYAAREALRATYRDASAIAAMMNRAERSNSALRVLMGSVVPFKKTPVNVLKRGVEYSPAGLLKGAYDTLYGIKKGKISKTEALDNLTAGLSGTAIVGLGYFLAKAGLLSGGEDDPTRKAAFDRNTGAQEYAITLPDGSSYTIDWLAPGVLPLMVGVELFQQFQNVAENETYGFDQVLSALFSITDPILELSMMEGVQGAISTFQQDSGAKFADLLANAVRSYTGQFVPTILGQIARTVDDTRRSTYSGKNDVTSKIEQGFKQSLNKLPGLSTLMEPVINHRGEEVKQEGDHWAVRLLLNTVSPGYYKKTDMTPADKEMDRLYNITGESGILPYETPKTATLDEKTYELAPKEYTEYAKTMGQTSSGALEKLIKKAAYQNMTDSKKAEIIKNINQYSKGLATYEYLKEQGMDYSSPTFDKPHSMIKKGISIEDYFLAYEAQKGIKGDKDKKGNTIALSTSKKKKEAIDRAAKDLSEEQKEILYEAFDISEKVYEKKKTKLYFQ